MKQFVMLGLILAACTSQAQTFPKECQEFLAKAEKMFQVVELDEASITNELDNYQLALQDMDEAKQVRMCSEVLESIDETIKDLEKQMKEVKQLHEKQKENQK
ncbi:hypothetical protein A4G20_10200 [Pasteurellaceae bacterium RH1A]|nr:hypothetical protein A4G20_10200 [Pasteurellaceae bacterium RH1A]